MPTAGCTRRSRPGSPAATDCALYHSALEVHLAGDRFVIEMGPVWNTPDPQRGVVGEGPVGLRSLGRSRLFRYEVRCWRDGRIPDVDEAVDSPQPLSHDADHGPTGPRPAAGLPRRTWGADEQHTGDMWNSNSLVSWLLARSGHDLTTVTPPAGGRAPGWSAGLVVAAREASANDEPARRHHVLPETVDRLPGWAGRRRAGATMSPLQRKAVVAGGVVELVVTAIAARDLYRRDGSQVRGPKALWFGPSPSSRSAPSDTCCSAGNSWLRRSASSAGRTALDPRPREGQSGQSMCQIPCESPLTALASIWLSAALTVLGAPDMVSGSQHEHLPLALITVWLWAAAATAYASMTPSRGSLARWTLGVVGLWVAAALIAVAAPVMVTGSDPTRIPLAVIIAPPVAAVLTGMLSLRQANLPERPPSDAAQPSAGTRTSQ